MYQQFAALQISTWYWLALGIALILAEVFFPGGVLLWLGVGAALVGIISIPFKLTLAVKLLIWLVTSTIFLAIWFRFFRDNDATRAGRAEATIGYTGVLVRPVAPKIVGNIKFSRPILGEEIWECEADRAIPLDTPVRVVAILGRHGQRVKVHPV